MTVHPSPPPVAPGVGRTRRTAVVDGRTDVGGPAAVTRAEARPGTPATDALTRSSGRQAELVVEAFPGLRTELVTAAR